MVERKRLAIERFGGCWDYGPNGEVSQPGFGCSITYSGV